MPFIALNQIGQRSVSYELPAGLYRQPWVCPQCGQAMLFVDCSTRLKHFRHISRSTCEWEPESAEHLILKKRMFEFFQEKGASCQYEQKIGEGLADLKITTDGGATIAVECQISPISYEALERRTLNYRRAGASVMWILYPKYYLQIARFYGGQPCYRLRELERLEMGRVLYYNKATGMPERLWFKQKWARGGGQCSSLYFLQRRERLNYQRIISYIYTAAAKSKNYFSPFSPARTHGENLTNLTQFIPNVRLLGVRQQKRNSSNNVRKWQGC